MIEIKNLEKIYPSKGGDVVALKDINLTIEDGDVYGIIGLSGAGKSTLVRCINLLEKPTNGQVLIDGEDLTKVSKKSYHIIVASLTTSADAKRMLQTYKEQGYELDVYIPAKRIAIEYDGSYWHRHKTEMDLEKNSKCKKDGIKLYRIREGLPSLNDKSFLLS